MHWSQNKLISNCFKLPIEVYLHIFCKYTYKTPHLISMFPKKVFPNSPSFWFKTAFLKRLRNATSPCSLLLQEICQLTTSLLRKKGCVLRTSKISPMGGCLPTKNDLYRYIIQYISIRIYVYVTCSKMVDIFCGGILMLRHMYWMFKRDVGWFSSGILVIFVILWYY